MVRAANHTYDVKLVLKDAGLVAASARALVGGVAKIIEVGTAQVTGDLIIDVSAIETATGDERYTIILEGSPDALFGTAGNIQELMTISVGAGAASLGTSTKTDVAGRIVQAFTNNWMGTNYPYLSIYTVVAGTIATGINYTAYAGMRQR